MTRCEAERALLALLTQIIADGEPCPTNAEIGERLKMGDTVLQGTFSRLKGKGLITVEMVQGNRVITIIATGESTRPSLPRMGGGREVVVMGAEEAGSLALHRATLAMFQRKAERFGVSIEDAARSCLAPVSFAQAVYGA